ncbi:MAG: hypothetical protein LBS41_06570 [Streptococcaceae bacterium]|nr:hypothetical protein [Streptococcaceae bacterium]
MLKKIKKNALLIAIVTILLGLGVKSTVSAIQVATVTRTKYEILYVYGGSSTSYTYTDVYFRNSFYCSSVETSRRDYGINPGYLTTYGYTAK